MNEQINIDSLMIRIPMKFVEVHDYDLIDNTWEPYLISEKTGNMKQVTNKKKQAGYRAVKRSKIGYTIQYQIKTIYDRHAKVGNQYLCMPVGAKFLNQNYLEGINLSTAPQLYKTLVNEGVVTFSFEDFINKSECTQIEFVQDFRLDSFAVELHKLKDKLVKSIKKNLNVKITDTRHEQSLRFTMRKEETISKPYVYLYNKEMELLSNSKEFCSAHLENQDINNLRRLEFRVKNRAHAEKVGIKDTALGTLLKLSQEDKLNILERFIHSYLGDVHVEVPTNLTPQKKFMLDSLKALLDLGVEFPVAVDSLLTSQSTKSKSQKRKILNSLYINYIMPGEVDSLKKDNGLMKWLKPLRRS